MIWPKLGLVTKTNFAFFTTDDIVSSSGALDFLYSPVLKERHVSLIWNFSGGLYWAILGRLGWGQISK